MSTMAENDPSSLQQNNNSKVESSIVSLESMVTNLDIPSADGLASVNEKSSEGSTVLKVADTNNKDNMKDLKMYMMDRFEVNNINFDHVINSLPAANFPLATLAVSPNYIKESKTNLGTWSYGRFNGKPVLLSSMHNLQQVECSKESKSEKEYLRFTLSIAVYEDLLKKNLKILRIGLHKKLFKSKFQDFFSRCDFVLLELDKEPDKTDFVEIPTALINSDFSIRLSNVAGKSVNGIICGKDMVHNEVTQCFSCIMEVCESSECSGTAMYAIPQDKHGSSMFVGIYKGVSNPVTTTPTLSRQRGIIVPIPTDPESLEWLNVVDVQKIHTIISRSELGGNDEMVWEANNSENQNSRLLIAESAQSFDDYFIQQFSGNCRG